MTVYELFMLAVWVWFCLVFIPARPMQSALFMIPVILIGLVGTLCVYVCNKLTQAVHATGEW